MNKQIHSGIMLTLLLIGMLTLAFNIQPAKAIETIYIRPDGSVDPPSAPIQRDGDLYTLIDNINGSIVIERDNIVVDGLGYTLQGTEDERGIMLVSRSNVEIKNMRIKEFFYGIELVGSESMYNTISGNDITDSYGGIRLKGAQSNTISGNDITNNRGGIILFTASYNNISQNSITANELHGIHMDFARFNNISRNEISHSEYGISLSTCYMNSLAGNNITNNPHGVLLYESSNFNTVSGNNITNNKTGVYLSHSSNNTVSSNNIIDSGSYGVYLAESSTTLLSGNNITGNKYGIWLDNSFNITLRNNIMTGNNYNFAVFWGSELSDFIHDIDESNTVDGKPIYYLVNCRDTKVPSNAGYVAIINSTNIVVEGLELRSNGEGILLAYTTNSQIKDSDITNNIYGVRSTYSSNVVFSGNKITENSRGVWLSWSSEVVFSGNKIANNSEGVGFYSSSNNRIYHNNFIGNTWQVSPYSVISVNIWDDGYPSGGNYWSDYEERYPDAVELDDSGIWNTPYVIDADNQDNYPLMEPWTPTPPIPTTIEELKTEIEELGSEGEIDNQGVVTSLIAKLNVAQKLVDKGRIDQAKVILEKAFILQVQNLSGIHMTPETADIIIKSAEYIISHL